MNWILHNNHLVKTSDYQLSIHNRGFLFGDGFFETMIYEQGNIQNFNAHLDRINNGLNAYKGTIDDSLLLELNSNIHDLISKNQLSTERCAVKLIFTRKGNGLYEPFSNAFEIFGIMRESKAQPRIKNSAVVFEDIRLSFSPISPYKNLSADTYVMAGIYKQEKQADEVILLGPHKVIAECLYSNIYWLKNNSLFTPSLESGCVAGISRNMILNKLIEHGYSVNEGLYKKDELLEADHVFISNVGGISSLLSIEGTRFSPIPDKFFSLINECY